MDSLSNVAPDILILIVSFLSPLDIRSLAQTCVRNGERLKRELERLKYCDLIRIQDFPALMFYVVQNPHIADYVETIDMSTYSFRPVQTNRRVGESKMQEIQKSYQDHLESNPIHKTEQQMLSELAESCRNLKKIVLLESTLEVPDEFYNSVSRCSQLRHLLIYARSRHIDSFIDMMNNIPQNLHTFWYISPLNWGAISTAFFRWIGTKSELRELKIGGSTLAQSMFPFSPGRVSTYVTSNEIFNNVWPELRVLILQSLLHSTTASNNSFWEKHKKITTLEVTDMDMKNFPYNAVPELQTFGGDLKQLVVLTKSLMRGKQILRPIRSISLSKNMEVSMDMVERLALLKQLESVEFCNDWPEELHLQILSMLPKTLKYIKSSIFVSTMMEEWITTLGRFPELKEIGRLTVSSQIDWDVFSERLKTVCPHLSNIDVNSKRIF